jgi:GH43 family beta-xylosidase
MAGLGLGGLLTRGVERGRRLADGVGTFVNPLYSGADPWVVRHDDSYYLTQADSRGRIAVWKSHSPTERGFGRVTWTPPSAGWNRAQVWAPEIHFIRGRWFIYYAASDGRNANHRMGVLEALTDDPQGPYADRGMLYTGDDVAGGRRNRWAIDGTVLELRGQLYLIWSGWEDTRDVQHLYVARMSDPCTVSGSRVRLCDNDTFLWERVGESRWHRGLNEGPQALVRNGRVFLVYSCSASWQATYKLGMLWMDESADPTDPRNWTKSDRPVFQSNGDACGVGHCCFTQSPDGAEDWILYHAKKSRRDGWDREVRAQRFTWHADGRPDFGRPVQASTPLALPSGCQPADPSSVLHLPTPAASPETLAA